MDVADFESVKLAYSILDSIELAVEYNPSVWFPSGYPGTLRGKSYFEQWKEYTNSYWFHFKFKDGSLILFEESSFRYINAPVKVPSKEEFLAIEFDGEWASIDEVDRQIYLSSSEFAISYQNFVDSVSEYSSYTPMRYDYSMCEKVYCRYTHPAFHLHIGFENESRIPVKVKLTPFAFSMFVVSTFYPAYWKKVIVNEYFKDETVVKLKRSLSSVVQLDDKFWCGENEECRLYLG